MEKEIPNSALAGSSAPAQEQRIKKLLKASNIINNTKKEIQELLQKEYPELWYEIDVLLSHTNILLNDVIVYLVKDMYKT
jgi:phosphoribosyl-ATP pyrophosphohydrolase